MSTSFSNGKDLGSWWDDFESEFHPRPIAVEMEPTIDLVRVEPSQGVMESVRVIIAFVRMNLETILEWLSPLVFLAPVEHFPLVGSFFRNDFDQIIFKPQLACFLIPVGQSE